MERADMELIVLVEGVDASTSAKLQGAEPPCCLSLSLSPTQSLPLPLLHPPGCLSLLLPPTQSLPLPLLHFPG